jgi:heterodisulfide reductase subunit A
MIQRVGSRREPRNYCSRVCCAAALKQAFAIRERNPQAAVYVLYRDMMTTGFSEAAFTRARQAGMVFIPYRLDCPPQVEPVAGGARVSVVEPVLGRTLAIEAQLVVLATGIIPALPRELAEAYGARLDPDGFFQEADSKWRPVDSLKEGVFACGLALAPRSIAESIATAEAAAERALRILGRDGWRRARSWRRCGTACAASASSASTPAPTGRAGGMRISKSCASIRPCARAAGPAPPCARTTPRFSKGIRRVRCSR